MGKNIETAREAVVELGEMLYQGLPAEERWGVSASFLRLYGLLAEDAKERVALRFIEQFLIWSKQSNWIERTLKAPSIELFVELARSIPGNGLLEELAEELSRIGWFSVEELVPYLGRPLSVKEIGLLCSSYCRGAIYDRSKETEFYNLAVRNGHGRGFANGIGMRIRNHHRKLDKHAD